jgi:hypothetical protein
MNPLILDFHTLNGDLCSYKASIEKINFEYPFDAKINTDSANKIKAIALPVEPHNVLNDGITSEIPGII